MHPLSTTRLVLGLLCLGFSGLWLADQAGWVGDSRYLFPVLLIGAGVVGLVAFAARGLVGRPGRAISEELETRPYEETDTEPLR